MMMKIRYFSRNPGKREGEIFFLRWSLVWMIFFGGIVISRVYEQFTTPWHYLTVGILLSLPPIGIPLLFPVGPHERAQSWTARYTTKANLWIFILSFIGNYLWTHYFYTVLGTGYSMPRQDLNGVPFALYLITQSYFLTYHTLGTIGLRIMEQWTSTSGLRRIRPRRRRRRRNLMMKRRRGRRDDDDAVGDESDDQHLYDDGAKASKHLRRRRRGRDDDDITDDGNDDDGNDNDHETEEEMMEMEMEEEGEDELWRMDGIIRLEQRGTGILCFISRWCFIISASLLMAFLEAFTLENYPHYFMKDRDAFYKYGTVFYALYFVVSFPMFRRLDERFTSSENRKGWDLGRTALDAFACCMIVTMLLDFWRLFIGPIV